MDSLKCQTPTASPAEPGELPALLELAASLLGSASARLGHTEPIAGEERQVYLKLMEKYQNTDPFKYILYSAKIDQATPVLDLR